MATGWGRIDAENGGVFDGFLGFPNDVLMGLSPRGWVSGLYTSAQYAQKMRSFLNSCILLIFKGLTAVRKMRRKCAVVAKVEQASCR